MPSTGGAGAVTVSDRSVLDRLDAGVLRRWLPRLVLVAGLAAGAGWLWLEHGPFDPDTVEAYVGGLGAWAPLVYLAVYVAATVLFLPGAIFGLAGGALFGPLWGVVWNLSGATAGATLAFLIGRYVASDWVARRTGGRLRRFIDGIEAEGWRFVALVRLVPLFPFNLSNYALGLTRIGLVGYVLASAVCMLPGTVAYTWLGHAGRAAAAGDPTAVRYGLAALGLLAAIVLVPRLVRRYREAGRASREPRR